MRGCRHWKMSNQPTSKALIPYMKHWKYFYWLHCLYQLYCLSYFVDANSSPSSLEYSWSVKTSSLHLHSSESCFRSPQQRHPLDSQSFSHRRPPWTLTSLWRLRCFSCSLWPTEIPQEADPRRVSAHICSRSRLILTGPWSLDPRSRPRRPWTKRRNALTRKRLTGKLEVNPPHSRWN